MTYNIYTDRGFTDLEIVVYAGTEAGDLQALNNKLEMQITAYCTAKGLPRFNNLCYRVEPISAHPSLAEMQAPGVITGGNPAALFFLRWAISNWVMILIRGFF